MCSDVANDLQEFFPELDREVEDLIDIAREFGRKRFVNLFDEEVNM